MKQKSSISVPLSGMNTSSTLGQLKNTEYTFLLNGNTFNEAGESTVIQNEPSNYLGVNFPMNYKVIGFKNDILKERTYYLLTNPTTRKSSIGFVENLIVETFNEDVQQECPDCEYSNILGEPLETTTQIPTLTYVELINDNCHIDAGREGLNFDINFPAKKIEIKQEKLGTFLYWNDNRNPKKYINVSNIEENPNSHYLITQEIPCDNDQIVSCILIDKLLTNPKHNKIQIQAETLQTGGNLKRGTYEFYAVYCDLLGNEMTNYSTPTNPISIFDENNNILSQTETDAFTNFAIKLKIKGLDSLAFKYYKVVCVERNNVDNTQSPFIEGIHPTTDDTIVYTHSGSSNDDNITRGNVSIKRRIDFNTLNLVKPNYDKAKGTMVSGGVMWDYGLHKREEINLQPVVNLFSSIASEWQTSAAKEDLYKSAIATSRYKGYMRNEVQPFAFRFFFKDGDYSAAFPWVGRPALPSDLTVVSDINYDSVTANTPACGVNTRNKKWQIFNTATITASCGEISGGATTEETLSNSCTIENVAEIPTNSITIVTEAEFQGLENYVESNPTIVIPEITPYIEDTYPESCTPTFGANCATAVLVNSYNEISTVLTSVTAPLIIGEQYLIQTVALGDSFSNVGFVSVGAPFTATGTTPTTWSNGTVVYITKETVTYTDKIESEYLKAQVPQVCLPYKRDITSGAYLQDTTFENNFMSCDAGVRKVVYKRDSNFVNENCNFAEVIQDNVSVGQSNFLNYSGDLVLANLLSAQDVDPLTVTANFNNKLHKKALFYKAEKRDRNKLIIEITPTTDCQSDADGIEDLKLLRYTIYDNCSSYNVLGGGIVSTLTGEFLILNTTAFPSTFLVAIDAPIKSEVIDDDCTTPVTPFTVYKILPPCGCFSIFTRDVETKSVDVTWSKILLNKIENYESECTFSIPEVDECEPKPYARGEFAYWESTETYPDNNQLYNSSTLKIKPSDLSDLSLEKREKFKAYFTEDGSIDGFGNYVLKSSTNLTCQPVRHPKFPDNTVAPFMYDSESQQRFAETIIFPLGITLDSDAILTMLKVALVNGLLTQKEFDNIEGYEILRGDNSIHKSVIANGLGFDMYNYEKEDKEKWWYSNFPFNDLGDDKFHTTNIERTNLIKHPYNGDSNHLYTFLSPDVFLTKPAIPTEMVLSGYQFGNATESVVDVKEHPKYTILGSDTRTLATTLAIAENVLEIATKTADFASQSALGNLWIVAGVSTGSNATGIAPALGIIGIYAGIAAAQGFIKLGQYRYEWLKTFRDLGASYNFASMTVGTGSYNRFVKVDSESTEYLRGLSIRKYLKEGLYNTVDKYDSTRINVNNWLREDSVLLSTGVDFKLNYPNEYKNYDNNKINSISSKMLSSDIDCKSDLNSTRNVASPYFSLKNYIPDQWGTVDSVKWLTTNYMFSLTDNTTCEPIFGGTVCISPFSWRRKTPLFRETAFKQPDKTPFNYSEHNNIGFTKYFIDYESDTEYNGFLLPFPDIDSRYKFDCETGRRSFYVKPPSKMYLYSYGVVNFLVESEINCHFRYAGKEKKDWFYPQVSNVAEWVQEKNMPISQPNTFFYNNSYSFPVSNTPYKFLDYTYDKEIWRKRNEQPNAVIYSEADNNENSLVDPWLVFKPASWYEFSTKFGKLIDLKDIESNQFFARFENQLILHNSVDSLADRITPQNKEIGTGGIFATRPLEFKSTDLGFAGTQHTEICSTPYGHYKVDAKRGKIFQIDQNGKNLETISEQVGNQPTNMKQWFREHLPFKILKSFPNIDIDNKFKGLGMNIWYDDRNSRIFFTKRDYIVKNNQGLEYEDGIGFYTQSEEPSITCSAGYTYNQFTGLCEQTTVTDACPTGFEYNVTTGMCEQVNTCEEGLDIVFILDATGSQQTSIDNIKTAISTGIVPAIVANFGADYRLGLISVKDRRTDGQALFDILQPMTLANETNFLTQINSIFADGGSNSPEPTDLALSATLNNTTAIDRDGDSLGGNTIGAFRTNAAKAIILVTDNPPSGLDDNYDYSDWTNAESLTNQANSQGIQIFSYLTTSSEPTPIVPIPTSQTPNVTYIMQNYATVTGGSYYFTPLGVGISEGVVDAVVDGIVCPPPSEVEPSCTEGCFQDDDNCICVSTESPIISGEKTPIYFDNTDYFENVSWTISFNPTQGNWGSYFSFYPDYSPFNNNYFQVGYNFGQDKGTLWNHTMTNSSFQIFQGRLNPFTVEYPIVNENANKMLNSLSLGVEAKRYQNQWDTAVNKGIGFNKMTIWNQTNNSGVLNLVEQKTISDARKYPITNVNNSQSILFVPINGKHNINYFFNRAINQDSNIPQWVRDANNIFKTINSKSVSFKGKRTNERLKGEAFLVNLTNDTESRFSITLRNSINDETLLP